MREQERRVRGEVESEEKSGKGKYYGQRIEKKSERKGKKGEVRRKWG